MIKTTTIIKSVTKTIIEVQASTLKANMVAAFRDIFNDYDITNADERDLYQADWYRFTDSMDQMDQGKYEQVFKDAYTMMLLDPSDFDAVEKFFKNRHHNRQPDTEIEIHVVSTPGTCFVVTEKDIQF
jgi:hypothetical protein